jgi:cell wall assembly regulator SMI1
MGNMRSTFGGTSEAAVKKFEGRLGETLPPDYRAFLLSDNGGDPRAEFWVPHWGVWDYLNSLYGVGLEDEFEAIEPVLERHEHLLLPEHVIPIGDDPGGNKVCLGIAGERRGRVYIWDHEVDPEEGDFLFELAPFFSAFIDRLKPGV